LEGSGGGKLVYITSTSHKNTRKDDNCSQCGSTKICNYTEIHRHRGNISHAEGNATKNQEKKVREDTDKPFPDI
jgi:hypothetical protein